MEEDLLEAAALAVLVGKKFQWSRAVPPSGNFTIFSDSSSGAALAIGAEEEKDDEKRRREGARARKQAH